MITVFATNITSPLGFTTEENYRAVREYRSELSRHNLWRGIPEPFVASMFNTEQRAALKIDGYTLFESVAIYSIKDALSQCSIVVDSPQTIFILSTTKANVDELENEKYLAPGSSARKIANYFGFANTPIVVCNACISGVDAQILALRLLSSGQYDNAIVCGVDMVTPFVIAGFLSFKSLSDNECKPFDIDRTGLNLGEAAATIVFGRNGIADGIPKWQLCYGAMSNDAYHISAPAPKGDGSYRAISEILPNIDIAELALLSVHGTATMFNDQMESKAIERTGLTNVPISALKGYYGHTLGAAGVLETIITMRSLDDGIILGVRGFEEIGVSGKVDISSNERTTDKHTFLKMISGFGGCNGALLYSKQLCHPIATTSSRSLTIQHKVSITPQSVVLDGDALQIKEEGRALLTDLYKRQIGDYPKFYKMDVLGKLAILATDLLMRQDENNTEPYSIILFNSSSSIVADRKHNASIKDADNFYPSPSLFLYTLPNIALGEVALKYNCTGETSLYILDKRDENVMSEVIDSIMSQHSINKMITGWIDCENEDSFEIDLMTITK